MFLRARRGTVSDVTLNLPISAKPSRNIILTVQKHIRAI
ncbi:hypothetical protein CES85_1892 [Ochrobactrum quorumnocens]|uniref:Uncharacterized protein n=1 Tax=Ochrobactrum quorumnocens TaxID=271865 RepID=A0A248UH67_9HYPH|nr:hypothetical protein CES85_1892 [[Ochrobactrum] quorumnocens]